MLVGIPPEMEDFVALMAREMRANSHKDQKGPYVEIPTKDLLADILYHAGKLAVAMKEGTPEEVEEYAADVGNLAMMTLLAYRHQQGAAGRPTSTLMADLS